MKVTLKLHPVSNHDMAVLANVMLLIAKDADIDVDIETEDKTGLAKTEGPVTQEKIKQAVSEYKAPVESQPKQPVEQKAPAAVTAPVSVATAPLVVAPVSAASPAAPTVTVETLRAKTQEKIIAGFREDVKGFLAEFGAQSVVLMDPKHFAAYNAKLDALK
jgi:hypothetical protein